MLLLGRWSEDGLGLWGKPAFAFCLWHGLLVLSFGFFLVMFVLVPRSVFISLGSRSRHSLGL